MSQIDANRITATESLLHDHKIVLQNLDILGQAARTLEKGSAPEVEAAKVKIGEAVAFLEKELELHLRKEEEVLFPTLEAVIGSGGGPTVVMRMEHEDLRAQTEELRRLNADLQITARASMAITNIPRVAPALCDLLRQHIHKEDFILFPMAEEALDEESLKQMAVRMNALQ